VTSRAFPDGDKLEFDMKKSDESYTEFVNRQFDEIELGKTLERQDRSKRFDKMIHEMAKDLGIDLDQLLNSGKTPDDAVEFIMWKYSESVDLSTFEEKVREYNQGGAGRAES
jgi:hypothetical protein